MPAQDTLARVSSPQTSTLLQNRSWGEGTGQIQPCFEESSTAPNKTRARTLVTAKIVMRRFLLFTMHVTSSPAEETGCCGQWCSTAARCFSAQPPGTPGWKGRQLPCAKPAPLTAHTAPTPCPDRAWQKEQQHLKKGEGCCKTPGDKVQGLTDYPRKCRCTGGGLRRNINTDTC